MPAGKMIARYGLSAHDVQNLYSRYKKQKLKVGFGSFDSFVKFCAECGYEPFMLMKRKNQNAPHSAENTYFVKRGEEKVKTYKKRGPKISTTTSRFCTDCQLVCPKHHMGCKAYKEWFVKNWNENIHSNTQKPEPVSPKTEPVAPEKDMKKLEFFRYEHPDLVREGILWTG